MGAVAPKISGKETRATGRTPHLLFQTNNCLPSTYPRQNKEQFPRNAERQWLLYRPNLSFDLNQQKTLCFFSFYVALLYTVQDVEVKLSDAHHKDLWETLGFSYRVSFIYVTIRITNRCDFLYYVFISFFSSFPYMFRAFLGPSSGVFQAVVFMLPFGSCSALLIVCVRQRTGLWW